MNYSQETIEGLIGKKLPFTKKFDNSGDTFSAFRAAEEYLRAKGFDVGSMQREAPIGVARDADISKWHNLGADRQLLDGAMVSGDWREGSVTVYLAFDPEVA